MESGDAACHALRVVARRVDSYGGSDNLERHPAAIRAKCRSLGGVIA